VYDVVIVGGGPAGLSAALVLGRCRRRVLVCDSGQPRNASSRTLHGYLTRDCTPPLELLRLGREELRPYGIEPRHVTVHDVTPNGDRFDVTLDGDEHVEARHVLLATGVRDRLPEVPGIDECYGISMHHCPYCDGWEVRDKRIAVIGVGAPAAALALGLKTWTDQVMICSNGRARIGTVQRQQLARQAIPIHQTLIARVDHADGWVRRIVLNGERTLPCDAIFFASPQVQSELPRRLGCELTSKGVVKTDHLGQTRVPGLFVVGDASRDVQFAIVAAAEGAKAGVAINKALQARAGLAVHKGGALASDERSLRLPRAPKRAARRRQPDVASTDG
jgi:thioredoxin reductase